MIIENVDRKNVSLSQPMLVAAILNEIANQLPWASVNNAQLKEVVKSANKLVVAFQPEPVEQAEE